MVPYVHRNIKVRMYKEKLISAFLWRYLRRGSSPVRRSGPSEVTAQFSSVKVLTLYNNFSENYPKVTLHIDINVRELIPILFFFLIFNTNNGSHMKIIRKEMETNKMKKYKLILAHLAKLR